MKGRDIAGCEVPAAKLTVRVEAVQGFGGARFERDGTNERARASITSDQATRNSVPKFDCSIGAPRRDESSRLLHA